jgi:hypothetical protein
MYLGLGLPVSPDIPLRHLVIWHPVLRNLALRKPVIRYQVLSETVYLETTAVIDASFKSFPEILSIISSADKSITSQYVKMEINTVSINKGINYDRDFAG